MSWVVAATTADPNAVHVFPVDDLVGHDTESDDCVCGPELEPCVRSDGSVGWLITHQSLDRREDSE